MQPKRRIHTGLWILMILAAIPVVVLLSQILFFDFFETDEGPTLSFPKNGEQRRISPPVEEPVDTIDDPGGETVIDAKPMTQIPPRSSLYKGIQARVVDSLTKRPITSFTVYYCSESGDDPEIDINMIAGLSDRAHAFRKRDGIMRILGLEEGKYSIAIKAGGYTTFIKRGLKVPQKENLLVFELPRGTFIEGKVIDVEGKPVHNVSVFLNVELDNPDDEPPARRVARTGVEGTFLFGGLPPGRYGLALSSLQRPLAEIKDVYLGPGGNHYQVLHMPQMTRLEFMITDAFGGPLPNTSIKLWSKDGSTVISLKTDMYGKASRDYVPSGDYELRISKNTYDVEHDKDFKILSGMPIIQITKTLVKR